MLGVLVVLPAYALLGTSLPGKLLPLLEHLAKRNEPQAGRDPGRPPRSSSLPSSPSGSPPYAPTSPAWPGRTVADRTAGGDYTPRRPAELSDSRSPNRLVSWEEAAPQDASSQQPPPSAATVRVRDDGRRVLSTDRFAQLEQALRGVGATHFTVSVENTGPTPSYWCSCQVVDRRDRFEAVAADALGAMEKVLREIHAWRSAAP